MPQYNKARRRTSSNPSPPAYPPIPGKIACDPQPSKLSLDGLASSLEYLEGRIIQGTADVNLAAIYRIWAYVYAMRCGYSAYANVHLKWLASHSPNNEYKEWARSCLR